MTATDIFACTFVVSALAHAPLARACEAVNLAQPARLSVMQNTQPTLSWIGDPTARYRVQIAALLPETRLVAAYDAEVVGTSFTLPAALPTRRAAVKVLITRACTPGDAQDLHAQGPAFFVDAEGACSLRAPGIKRVERGWAWDPEPRAQSYLLRVFRWDPERGELTQARESTLPTAQWEPPAQHTGPRMIASIQPVCDGVAGRPVAWPLGD